MDLRRWNGWWIGIFFLLGASVAAGQTIETTPVDQTNPVEYKDELREDAGPRLSEPASPKIPLAESENLLNRPREYGVEARLLFPEVLGIAGTWRYNDTWQFGVEAGYMAYNIILVSANITSYGVFGMWHPYEGAFYLGSGLGQQSLGLKIGDTISLFDVGLESAVTTTYLRGYMGWQWIYESGFTWGFRFGLQAPLGTTSSLDVNVPGASDEEIQAIKDTNRYRELESVIETVGEYIGTSWVPLFSVVHVGWYF